ncbi:MAG: hypothetical protein KZQ82_13215 [Candidatus Thiodiazotropha sp. (ex Lucinoma annulata)]|nr:hypothetical protein [Candidatus Thiodiazotropha sp. (ex Lucinoma borealis)]MCU7885144.1 hypothetical protein [Candidatus Thiodiazotropha sp. (ex Lucinoma annulata)]MCU7947016.1 hypothetical protein [Candidatus Thiodiazotropha sp. (ex Cardiolucina cf. quadrata)]MCU7857978.1 hypothetical protein [Candidatus Thiodiazotropha sp. (ex Lucinoma borealis)]MCU7864439.1 hypothetical protein [Candidatus Thiodiazotropha sp. (ex Lucinoma borealis)]
MYMAGWGGIATEINGKDVSQFKQPNLNSFTGMSKAFAREGIFSTDKDLPDTA